ncbi:hypothetical protein [Antarctobacter jejuensis]|uniref:hypothetical protein n=1 Tax=Antarctobacter jejuensis TaxID=1439938 RepID=UPI003FD157CA
MKILAKMTLAALALSATAAAAAQGDKITALGYGHTQQQAKIVTIQTWTNAAHDAYGYADWNTAYIGHMECIQNPAYASNKYSTLSREIIKTGGDQTAPWSCIVSGFQDVKTTYDGTYKQPDHYGGHDGGFTPTHSGGYTGNAYKGNGYSGGYTDGYSGGYTGNAHTGGSTYKY